MRTSVSSVIPNILHQIWVGNARYNGPLPEYCRPLTDEMRNVHVAQGWEYHLWGDELYELYKNDPFVQSYRVNPYVYPAHIADRFRLLLLRDFGGVYCDVDAKLVKSFDTILDRLGPEITFFAGMRHPDHYHRGNCTVVEVSALGSSPNGRIINEALSIYTTPAWANGGLQISLKIGACLDADATLFNYRYFYAEEIYDETIILHDAYRLRSWVQR